MKSIKTYISKKVFFCLIFALEFFIIGVLVYNCQNFLKIDIISSVPTEVFRMVAQSLLIFIPFVGTMLIFGFGRIRDELKTSIYTEELKNLKAGWKNGMDLFLSFSFYVSLIVLFNITLLIFHKMSIYTLGFLLADVALVFGALYLTVGIAVKIFDLDKKLIE